YRPVMEGDTLSAIAALYRPTDVSTQQAWMAFYKLNQEAFPDANLNRVEKGTRLRIPDEAQMKAMSRSDAIREVKKLSRPLTGAGAKKAEMQGTATQLPATLVVGGSNSAALVQGSSESGHMNAADTQAMSVNEQKSYDQLALIVAELGAFTQAIKQEISDSRGRDILFKEELIAARGENRVLTGRMERLEAQLSRMSQLLELQSNALQSLNANIERGQATQPGLALNQLEPTETAVTPAPPEIVAEDPAAPAIQTGEQPKTYYEQLLDVAISDAPEADKSYIEEVLGQSSTSIGQEDANPVTPEMQAEAAAKKSASPQLPANQATATMLANVRASLGDLPASDGVPKTDVKIDAQDSAYIDALNDENRSQIQKSEARIAELQKELQAKIDATQAAADATPAPVNPEKAAPAETKAQPQNPVGAAAPDKSEDAGLISSLMSGFSALSAKLGGLSSDLLRLLGGIGAAIIGLMVILGLRRRRRDGNSVNGRNESLSNQVAENEPDVADIATRSMQHEPEEDEDLEEELHGSSLFDLSDESFMASEAIQDDSSLFSLDDDNEDFDSLTDMDSAQFGQQTGATQTVDVDPVAEADVYLAYDRKEQAIEVLEQALSSNPNQSAVVIKLLGLYQASENIEGFTRLFESSAEHIEDDNDWNQIKLMAQDFVPGHEMLADDFDSSIPVLMDEVVSETEDANLAEAEVEEDSLDEPKLSMTGDTDNFADLLEEDAPVASKPDLKVASSEDAALNDDEDTSESLNFSMDSDQNLQLDKEPDSTGTVEEINQHEPDTALALAKAYIELGEEDIAKDFLLDVVKAGSDDLKSEAEEMLASLS
ncbi:MAG: hypothetical protein GY726_06840, partial [Proteobacteria bacterium]|nr:hypothetical protein [Pseudomonadota bacterium]